MEIMPVLQWAGTFLTGAVGVWAITEGIKRAPSIKSISPGQANKVRAVALVASAVLTLVTRWTSDSLDVATVQGAGQALLDCIAIFAGSQVAYGVAKAKEETDLKEQE